MISIRNSLSELEKCHQRRMDAVECYMVAIENVAHYTIDLDPSITEPQRGYLTQLAREVSLDPEELKETGGTLRALLRDYRDKATRYLGKIYEELETTTTALEQILGSLSQTDGEHEARLRASVSQLKELAKSSAAAAIRPDLLTAASAIERDIEEMRRQHHLTAAQFQVEISMLHKRIDGLEAAAAVDKLTDLLNRREMEERIASAAPGYTMLLIRATGFHAVERLGPEVAADLLGAFSRRLRNSLPETAVIARWGYQEFAAILSLSAAETTAVARSIAEQLSGSYSCLREGKTIRPSIQLTVAVVDSEGNTAERVMERVKGFLTSSAAG